ncbi:MAG: ABC transporter permease [Cellulosilyticaceae bacterium]
MIEYMITSTLRMGTPIALTALGGIMSERSGVVNIGLEGVMLASAFGAVVGSNLTGSPWMGILFAVAIGIVISAIHSVISVTWGGNQSVSSMALVLLATGLSGVGLKAVFNQQGSSPQVANLPNSPIFKDIPVVGEFLSSLSPFVYIAFIALGIVYYVFKYTPLGLRITTVGENPKAAETAGISVAKTRYMCVICSGILAGLGGAFLSIGPMNLFQEGMVAGRGYLALGAVTMGKWSPLGAFGAAMLFGFFEAVQLYVQTIPNNPIPSEFIQMIPYIASLVIMATTMNKSLNTGIASSGKPYTKFVQQR